MLALVEEKARTLMRSVTAEVAIDDTMTADTIRLFPEINASPDIAGNCIERNHNSSPLACWYGMLVVMSF